jgi:hypothetical protein
MIKDDTKITRTDTKMTPTKTVSRSPNFGTLAADYAKVTTSQDTATCTFTFFQSHPIPKIGQEGIILESVEEEMILEVKMPFNTAFALALYMATLVKDIQANPTANMSYFGPTKIKATYNPSEEKKQ